MVISSQYRGPEPHAGLAVATTWTLSRRPARGLARHLWSTCPSTKASEPYDRAAGAAAHILPFDIYTAENVRSVRLPGSFAVALNVSTIPKSGSRRPARTQRLIPTTASAAAARGGMRRSVNPGPGHDPPRAGTG